MKIGGPPGSHGNSMAYNTNGSKNVRIMLVGNGNKSSQNAYKQNMNDMKGLQFSTQGNVGMNQGGNFPKTTKNGNNKFYSQGASQDLMGAQMLQIKTNKPNTFRNDGVNMMSSPQNQSHSNALRGSHNLNSPGND